MLCVVPVYSCALIRCTVFDMMPCVVASVFDLNVLRYELLCDSNVCVVM